MTYPGTQFPIEAYEQFMKQGVPRWTTTDKQIVAAYIELVDKVCPCVVMVHSQSGTFGFQVLEARPDKVKALVAVEPTVGGDRNKVASLKNTPVAHGLRRQRQGPSALVAHPPGRRRLCRRAARPRAAASISSICRTSGIKGNSHMVMMDKNSDQVADLIQKWLVEQRTGRLNRARKVDSCAQPDARSRAPSSRYDAVRKLCL